MPKKNYTYRNLLSNFETIKKWILDHNPNIDEELQTRVLELEDFVHALDYSSIIAITDHRGVILDVNETFCKISEYTREELIGETHRILNSGLHDKAFFRHLWETIQRGEIWEGEIRNKTKSGRYYWVKTTIFPYLDEEGEPFKYLSIRTDITRGKIYEERLRKAIKNEYSQVVKNLHNLVFKVQIDENNQFRVSLFEGLLAKKIGYSTTDVYNKTLEEVFPDVITQEIREKFENAFLGSVETFELEFNDYQLFATVSPIDANGRITEVVCSASDISDLKKSELKIQHMAYHNQLTDLPNRFRLDEDIITFMSQAEENNESITIIMIDLDHFKNINDIAGHFAGDTILLSVAMRLAEIDFGDLVIERRLYHLGGDEFYFLLRGLDKNRLEEVIKKIYDVFSKAFTYNELEFYITTSIGISVYPSYASNPEELLKQADMALYAAKDIGRNTYQIYNDEINEEVMKKLELQNEIRKALENDEFVLFYQPQLDLATNKIVGVEALIRWFHKTKGYVPPSEFIPIAEESGTIISIGEWVLQEVCRQIKKWNDEGICDIVVSINIATQHFQQRDFLQSVCQIVNHSDVCNTKIDLEITEGSLLKNTEKTIEMLQELRNRGFQISIDDFGTGYSSLGYLKNFPITTLKIDQSFIRNLPSNKEDQAIVSAIINLAKSLNMKVIAEGVETKEALDILKNNGCDMMQGYYFSKPLPADEVGLLIKRHNKLDKEMSV